MGFVEIILGLGIVVSSISLALEGLGLLVTTIWNIIMAAVIIFAVGYTFREIPWVAGLLLLLIFCWV